ncbi:MAG: Stp1/IreP family PP2C-type Ser/Thr phosphatase [Deltaproteobacteria bacterium]|nr:MAG: Stp1/IreP family PP2C-type Ser/Thr phosphatase [Deltaproteobacteria bacterium]
MKLTAAGLSDVGLKRGSNEDYFVMDTSTNLYIVADGMGGHLAGEIASKIAANTIRKNVNHWITKNSPEDELFDFPDSTLSRRGNYILSGIRLANRVIYEMSREYAEYKGMGTTIVVLAIMHSAIIAANVGDSRIYLIRGNMIEPLSKEHNMVAEQLEMGLISKEEAQNSPLKHILTRNLGSSDTVNADIFEVEPMNNDRFLLCTDGLTDHVSDDKILRIIRNGDDPEHLCQQLVSEANERGGNDNISVSLIFVDRLDGERQGLLKRFWYFFKK